jgi:predicted ATP-binding protein involved in virulence
MQVKRLQISAFRGIESLDLEFRPGATVLIGVNGVGKSSILECLAKLIFLYTDLILPRGLVPYWREESIKNGKLLTSNSITFETTQEEIGEWGFISHSGNTQGIATDSAQSESDGHSHSQGKKPGELTQEPEGFLDAIQAEITEKIDQDKENINIPLGVYYPTSRIIPSSPLEDREGLSHKHQYRPNFLNIQALEGRLDFTEFFTWFKDREDLENETRLETNPDHRDRQLEAIRNAIPIFLPGFSQLRIKRSPRRMVVTKNGQELIISQLSDGEKSLLTIIGDIARRLAICNPALENPLEGEGIILIDEIDAHLHPKWQRDLVPKLVETFPNCQFFITTHSPQIISDVRSENIYLLKQDEAGEVIAVHPDGTYGRDSNQILEDVMGVSARPELVDRHLKQLFRLIDSGDLSAARDLKNQLESAIGIDEPEFAKADVLIRRKEILGR